MVEAICQGVVDHISVDDFDRGRSIRFRKGHNLEGIGDLIGLYLVGGWESDVCGKPDGLFLVGDDRPGGMASGFQRRRRNPGTKFVEFGHKEKLQKSLTFIGE